MELAARLLGSKRARGNLLLSLLWIAIALLLFVVREVLLPFLLAIFLAYLLQPIVRRMRRIEFKGRHLSPGLTTVVVYLIMFALVGLVGRVTFPAVARELVKMSKLSSGFIAELSKKAPTWPDQAEQFLARYEIPVHFVWGESEPAPQSATLPAGLPEIDAVTGQGDTTRRGATLDVDLKKELSGTVTELTELIRRGVTQAVVQAQGLARNLVQLIFRTFLVLMVGAFILSDTERISRFVFSMVPINDQEVFDNLLERIDRGLSGVVRGQVIICLVNGTLTLVGLLILGIPLPFLLAGLATLLSLIPIFGSIISTIPIVAIALTNSFSLAVLALIWVVIIHLLEANLLNPKIMGDAAKIHPVVVVLALIVGEHYYGLSGALFAVPIASILLTFFKYAHQRALTLQSEAGAEGLPGGASPQVPTQP